MNLQSQLVNLLVGYKRQVEELIRGYLDQVGNEGRLKEACAYALLNGGKRFRPALVLMISKALGRANDANGAALAIEFFHTASLIADDLPCMDDDDERRGRPSVHCAFDEATALLASYALIGAGYDCLARNCLQLGKRGADICALVLENAAYNTGLQGASGGQWLDLRPPDLSEATLRRVIHQKTVSLFEIAFVFGWMFGGGSVDKLPLVKQAASHFGTAFQIADDLGDDVQDAANGSLVNAVAILGRPASIAMLRREIDGYRKALKNLGLANAELLGLVDLLDIR